MVTDNTEEHVSNVSAVGNKAVGDVIDAGAFREMVDILDSLLDHQHNFTDNYVSNCECQCSSGTL
jgi:hypothetical protein